MTMGFWEFAFGLGASRESKMALFITSRMPKHFAGMMRHSDVYYNTHERSGKRSEVEAITAAAFVSYFFLCLSSSVQNDDDWQAAFLAFVTNVSSNLRCLVEECVNAVSPKDKEVQPEDQDRRLCGKWLWDRLSSYMPLRSDLPNVLKSLDDMRMFYEAFNGECIRINTEVVEFKDKFFR